MCLGHVFVLGGVGSRARTQVRRSDEQICGQFFLAHDIRDPLAEHLQLLCAGAAVDRLSDDHFDADPEERFQQIHGCG